MTTLYKLNSEMHELFQMAEAEEVDAETFTATWESLALERDEKISSYCDLYKSWCALADAIKHEAKTLNARAAACERRAEGLKNFLRRQIADREEFQNARHKFVWRSSKAVVVDDETQVPGEYLIPQPPKIDRKAIGEDLKLLQEGESFGFAYMEERLNFTIK